MIFRDSIEESGRAPAILDLAACRDPSFISPNSFRIHQGRALQQLRQCHLRRSIGLVAYQARESGCSLGPSSRPKTPSALGRSAERTLCLTRLMRQLGTRGLVSSSAPSSATALTLDCPLRSRVDLPHKKLVCKQWWGGGQARPHRTQRLQMTYFWEHPSCRAAILCQVELATSEVRTSGVPSTTFAMAFSTAG